MGADGLFKLMDANVTRGNLKNLVTDKPSPITVGLAQTGSKGFPVHVNPESTLYSNTQAATNFGFVDVPVGLDEVNFLQMQHQAFLRAKSHDEYDEDDEDEEVQRMRRQMSDGMF